MQPEPETVILQAQKKLAEEKSLHVETKFTLDGVLDRPEISFGESRVTLTGTTRTDTDRSNPVVPVSSSTFDFTLASGEDRIVLRGEGRRADYQHYLRMDEVSDTLFPGIEELEGEWMRSSEPFHSFLITPIEDDLVLSDLTAEGYEEVHGGLTRVPLLHAVDTLPSEEIDGVKTFHYAVELIPEALAAFMTRIKELRTGEPAAPEDYALELAKVLSWGRATGEVWIGKDDLRFRKIRLSGLASEATGGARWEADIWFTKFGVALDVEIPDATDVEDLLGRVISGRLHLAGDRLFSFFGKEKAPLPPSEKVEETSETDEETEKGVNTDEEPEQAPEEDVPGEDVAEDIDTDGDGLSDSEEFFYGSDPWNPDTDGDGWPDGVEVANGKDPLGPGALFGFGL